MKSIRLVILGSILISLGATVVSNDLKSAEAFIDAFYSYDEVRLAETMDAGDEGERALYYQAWAEAANYQIKKRRRCTLENGSAVCKITVTDDFGRALGYTATDTFVLTVENDLMIGVQSQGDDPPIFMELFDWISKNQPEVLAGPCADMFAGGQTPGECSRSVVLAANQFMKERGSDD